MPIYTGAPILFQLNTSWEKLWTEIKGSYNLSLSIKVESHSDYAPGNKTPPSL